MLAKVADLRALEARAAYESAKSKATFDKRGQLLPRERIALLLDTGAPWLALMSLAGYGYGIDLNLPAAERQKLLQHSVPGGGCWQALGR